MLVSKSCKAKKQMPTGKHDGFSQVTDSENCPKSGAHEHPRTARRTRINIPVPAKNNAATPISGVSVPKPIKTSIP